MALPPRLAISPIVSSLNWLLPWLFSGGFLVEMVLGLPTAGLTLAGACFSQDMYLAASYILIIGFLTSVSSLLSDFLLAAVDPRIRFGAVSAA